MNNDRLCPYQFVGFREPRVGTYATTPERIVLIFNIGGSVLVDNEEGRLLGTSNICNTVERLHAVPRNKVVTVSREQHGIC